MADSRDITGKNRKFKGTDGIVLPKGTEAQRADTESGELRFNTDTNLAEYYDGTSWKPIDAPPTITGVSPTSWISDGTTQQTFTVSGSNFQSGATAKFVGNDGTEYTSTNLNVVSSVSFTIQNMTTMGVANEPYDIIFTNPSGLAATLEDAVDAGSNPSFATAADTNIGTVNQGDTDFSGLTTVAATDADGQTVTHTKSAGNLPPGVTLTTAGALTGTVGTIASSTDYTFTVSATDGFNTVTRQFVVTGEPPAYILATGGTITESGNFRIHTFTGDGTFTVSATGTTSGADTVGYVVVAGGGAGGAGGSSVTGGGGGAGGYREGRNVPIDNFTASPLVANAPTNAVTVSATSYPITVGSGGSSVGPGDTTGTSGNNSVFSSITSAGGGGGGGNGANETAGGSGGGGKESDGAGASGNSPPVSPPQGQPGGTGSESGNSSGGGGGAGGSGGNAISSGDGGGAGGSGVSSSITGSSVPRAGGGSANASTSVSGGGGLTGGAPAYPTGADTNGFPGTANTGGGGGASISTSPFSSGAGGSGIVIIRYRYQ